MDLHGHLKFRDLGGLIEHDVAACCVGVIPQLIQGALEIRDDACEGVGDVDHRPALGSSSAAISHGVSPASVPAA
ncbi:Uncharacterised protein [Mycobacteroides abscessus subsp. massiliense]|nr:Uncharacterised protein [Mycobacteroides abscessus subsp. massiliense]